MKVCSQPQPHRKPHPQPQPMASPIGTADPEAEGGLGCGVGVGVGEFPAGGSRGAVFAAGMALANVAFAAGGSIGGGLISYATPIILFLGVGSIVVALVGSAVGMRPENAKNAWYAAAILLVVFAILKNVGALQAAVQAG